VRNSLGLCKHVLAVLAGSLASKKKVRSPPAAAFGGVRLEWNPVRPLTGDGDWLERVRLAMTGADAVPHGLARLFRKDGRLRSFPSSAADREAHLDALADASGQRGVIVDPALSSLLRHERDRAATVRRVLPVPTDVKRALRSLKRRLYPYQQEGLRRFLSSGRLLLADDMGLGKTAQAIAAAHVLLASRKITRGLLIVPASLKDQWQREWKLFTDAPLRVVDGPPAERARAYGETQAGFLVTSYEQMLRDLDVIQRWRPEIVVLDEAQRMKNWATKTATYVKALTPALRLVLTGTPMENRLDELASLLDWVDDMALEPKWRLIPFHAQYADGEKDVVGAQHLDTLRARLAPCLLRRGRSEVLSQLPPRTDTLVPVAITETQAEAHADLDRPIAQLLSVARRRPLTQPEFLRLMSLLTTQRIIANGMALYQFQEAWPALSKTAPPDEARLRELASPKLSHLREILAQVAVEQGRKVVVFSQWRRMLTLAHWATSGLLKEAGLRAVFFTGAESSRRRTQNLVDFHDDPDSRVLFASDAGGVGLNLQRAASCCINLELPWNPAVLEQRIGRIYRLGQRQPIDVYNLVTESGIEARIAGLVSDKKALFSGLFDGDTSEVRFERSASFLARLERIVEPTRAPETAAEAGPEEEASATREIDQLVASAEGDDVQNAPIDEAPHAHRPPEAPASVAARTDVPADVRGLLSRLKIQRRADGGLSIEAPPEAADGLAALFEGMASLMRQAGSSR
jgi:SNF2 family DNA or RNA helicase